MAEEFKPGYNFSDDRLKELLQLFPEAFEDGKFNVDTLKELIGDYSTDNTIQEHFGLNWVGKKDARRMAAKPPTGTLKPCINESRTEIKSGNIFIEGDNLEVLKILKKSYHEKIKVIYIDPPYNTGNDFIYNDDFSDSTEDYLKKSGEKSEDGLLVSNPKTSGKYHGNWLSFMYPRLRVARDLLCDDGIVFISIDDHEIDNLRLLCDEIFGEENFYSQIIIRSNSRGQTYNQVAKTHEYLLVYTKNSNTDLLELEKDSANSDLNLKDNIGQYSIRELRNRNPKFGKHNRPNLFFPIYLNPNETDENGFYPVQLEESDEYSIKIEPFNSTGKESCWRWGTTKFKENNNNDDTMISNVIGKIKNDGSYGVYEKYRKTTYKVKSIWDDNTFLTETGTIEVKKLGFDNEFEFPKPINLIKQAIALGTEDGDIVMDFFAGSGTTAQAVIESGKQINFICVQIPVKIDSSHPAYSKGYRTIAELTKERIERSLELKQMKNQFLHFTQSSSTIYKWQDFDPEKGEGISALKTQMELAFKNPVQDGTSVDDFVTEILLNEGFPLTANKEDVGNGIYKISHEWVPYTLFVTMTDSLSKEIIDSLSLDEKDHFVCLDKAFQQNDSLKQTLDNKCKLFTI